MRALSSRRCRSSPSTRCPSGLTGGSTAIASARARRLPATRAAIPAQRPASAGPRTAMEETVASLWRRLLGTSVGVDDDFFLAGGQSLLAAQLAARLSALLNIDMPLSVF